MAFHRAKIKILHVSGTFRELQHHEWLKARFPGSSLIHEMKRCAAFVLLLHTYKQREHGSGRVPDRNFIGSWHGATGRCSEMKWHMCLCVYECEVFTPDLTWDFKLFRWILQMGYFSIFHLTAGLWGICSRKCSAQRFRSIFSSTRCAVVLNNSWVDVAESFFHRWPPRITFNVK